MDNKISQKKELKLTKKERMERVYNICDNDAVRGLEDTFFLYGAVVGVGAFNMCAIYVAFLAMYGAYELVPKYLTLGGIVALATLGCVGPKFVLSHIRNYAKTKCNQNDDKHNVNNSKQECLEKI